MKKQNQKQQTPGNNIHTRARGNFTIGFYLVDLFAGGTKDTFFLSNITLYEPDNGVDTI
jgi:hypothetical protein